MSLIGRFAAFQDGQEDKSAGQQFRSVAAVDILDFRWRPVQPDERHVLPSGIESQTGGRPLLGSRADDLTNQVALHLVIVKLIGDDEQRLLESHNFHPAELPVFAQLLDIGFDVIE